MIRLLLFALISLGALCSPLSATAAPDPIRVVYLNLRNYFVPVRATGKTRASFDELHRQIVSLSPDILVVSELGNLRARDHLHQQLADRGLDYPFATICQGADDYRTLGLFSRYQPQAILHNTWSTYELNEVQQPIRRGFLHCVFDVDGYVFSVVGAHLKSKVFDPLGQTDMRRYEARQLRYLVTEIIKPNDNPNILVVGDMNDDPNSSPILSIINNRFNEDKRLWDLRPTDDRGLAWTHFWDDTDGYSRYDYAFASLGMLPEINFKQTKIPYFTKWQLASDHRPLLVTISPEERSSDETERFEKSVRRTTTTP